MSNRFWTAEQHLDWGWSCALAKSRRTSDSVLSTKAQYAFKTAWNSAGILTLTVFSDTIATAALPKVGSNRTTFSKLEICVLIDNYYYSSFARSVFCVVFACGAGGLLFCYPNWNATKLRKPHNFLYICLFYIHLLLIFFKLGIYSKA